MTVTLRKFHFEYFIHITLTSSKMLLLKKYFSLSLGILLTLITLPQQKPNIFGNVLKCCFAVFVGKLNDFVWLDQNSKIAMTVPLYDGFFFQ